MFANVCIASIAGVVGIAIGGGTAIRVVDRVSLAQEQRDHAFDNAANTQKLAAISDRAAKAASDAIAANYAANNRILALNQRYHQENKFYEQSNSKNRASIANGTRRLRIAIQSSRSGDLKKSNSPPGGMGNGAGRYADISPKVGENLFGIVDDADRDARAKAEYLQHYVCSLQHSGVIAGRCVLKDPSL
ncbi:hypothetical protein [Caballeronia sp. LZ035]|uniref:hypothetical protein n=1 Tax=Caballeronia sp. LZ035 TaxID=3038568 RepID=UPI0028572D22|nr:hypothetical protein [Caballeronia sp. LZ035]MDR5756512.1 hypothetical protein [Caballeronia sp. LZ035]